MAIYRPEQAQLTYAAEAAYAADPELAKGNPQGSGWTGTIAEASAGSLELTLTQASSLTADPTVGDFIQIGATVATYANSVDNHEIRRIEWWSGPTGTRVYSIGLDRPTGFYHPATTAVTEINALLIGTTYDNSKIITNIPGVYEAVDVPDMESAMEPQYFLGTKNRRSFQTILKNQQTYDSSLEITPLDGQPFRWSVGKVTTCAEDMDSAPASQTLVELMLTGDANTYPRKGDIIVRVDDIEKASTMPGSGSGIQTATGNHYVTFTDSTSVSDHAVTDTAAALMGANPESRRVVQAKSISGVTGDGYIWLDKPLQFDHAVNTAVIRHGLTSTTQSFRHVISETDALDTMTWHVHMLDSAESGKQQSGVVLNDVDFDRRYTGGKVGSTTISAEESGLVSVNWETINFRGMHHNNRNHYGVTTANSPYDGANVDSNMPFFALMQDIKMSDVNYPSTEPYYFSDGQLKFFGQTFAQIRSFSLSINNNTEPRYYVQRSYGKFRGPNEIREQRREYGLTATVVLPDSSNVALARGSMTPDSRAADAVATGLFRELLLEGDYGKPGASIMKGFTASIRFDRGTDDFIIIDIPQSQSGSAFNTGGTYANMRGKPIFSQAGNTSYTEGGTNYAAGNAGHGEGTTEDVGLFIRSAKHSLTTDAPLQVELDTIFKNMVIYIKDNEPSYI
tara:strand:+ start:977 stop:3016 length:2040 start_codon:yes stop_codon:yes gene_type:complete